MTDPRELFQQAQAEAPAADEAPARPLVTDGDADGEALLDFLRAVIRHEVRDALSEAMEERGL